MLSVILEVQKQKPQTKDNLKRGLLTKVLVLCYLVPRERQIVCCVKIDLMQRSFETRPLTIIVDRTEEQITAGENGIIARIIDPRKSGIFRALGKLNSDEIRFGGIRDLVDEGLVELIEDPNK